MSSSESEHPAAGTGEFLAAKNVAIVTTSIGVMAVILGVCAVAIPSLALWLAVFTVVEVLGVLYMSTRLPQASQNLTAESQVRAARGLAMLATALALVAAVRAFG
jgi:hypothetical protein